MSAWAVQSVKHWEKWRRRRREKSVQRRHAPAAAATAVHCAVAEGAPHAEHTGGGPCVFGMIFDKRRC